MPTMTSKNISFMTGFTIQGFSDIPELQMPLFILFLLTYVFIIIGNIILIAAISLDYRLHTPMYMFLLNLAFLDISYTSAIIPSMLHVLLMQHDNVSFTGCLTQTYLFISLACTEMFLLAAMAYDRYVAVCHPLHYVLLMNPRLCAQFVSAAWIIGFLDPTGLIILLSKLSFCASHLVEHFFCDATPLLKLSCSSTFKVEVLIFIQGALVGLNAFILTLISYIFIISTILKIHSAKGREKAFSTCASHLTCVIIFYLTLMCLYMRPTSNYSPSRDKFFSVLYIVLVPLLNPVAYSLKNKEVKSALNKLAQVGLFLKKL